MSFFSKCMSYVTIKATSLLFLENNNLLYFYCSLKREKIIFWPLPLIPPKYYCIHSFWSQNTEKRNNTISQMRLRSVFKMRTSILNTATTEQMGYGIISFFVCFPLMNQIVNLFYFDFYSMFFPASISCHCCNFYSFPFG